MPLAAAYMDELESAKPEASRLHLFHSAGGMASPEALRDLPLGLAASRSPPPASPPQAAWRARSGSSVRSASTWAAPPRMSA